MLCRWLSEEWLKSKPQDIVADLDLDAVPHFSVVGSSHCVASSSQIVTLKRAVG